MRPMSAGRATLESNSLNIRARCRAGRTSRRRFPINSLNSPAVSILVQAEWCSLTRLLAWNYGEHFEWQRVAAGSNLFSAVPCGQERSQLDGQHDRQPGVRTSEI